MRSFRYTLVFLLTVCMAAGLVVGCENGSDDDNDDSDGTNGGGEEVVKSWLPYAGSWYGSGLREVWVNVSEDTGIVTVRDNVNPGSQSQPWSDSLHFEFQGGPTCTLDFHSADSATVRYTSNSYAMSKVSP